MRAGTVEQLEARGLIITEAEVLEGERLLAAHGLAGTDAEYALFLFLERRSPYGRRTDEVVTFPGWAATTRELREATAGLDFEEATRLLFDQYGSDSVRVAVVLAQG